MQQRHIRGGDLYPEVRQQVAALGQRKLQVTVARPAYRRASPGSWGLPIIGTGTSRAACTESPRTPSAVVTRHPVPYPQPGSCRARRQPPVRWTGLASGCDTSTARRRAQCQPGPRLGQHPLRPALLLLRLLLRSGPCRDWAAGLGPPRESLMSRFHDRRHPGVLGVARHGASSTRWPPSLRSDQLPGQACDAGATDRFTEQLTGAAPQIRAAQPGASWSRRVPAEPRIL